MTSAFSGLRNPSLITQSQGCRALRGSLPPATPPSGAPAGPALRLGGAGRRGRRPAPLPEGAPLLSSLNLGAMTGVWHRTDAGKRRQTGPTQASLSTPQPCLLSLPSAPPLASTLPLGRPTSLGAGDISQPTLCSCRGPTAGSGYLWVPVPEAEGAWLGCALLGGTTPAHLWLGPQ